MKKLLLSFLPLFYLFSCTQQNNADLIVINAKVYTVDEDFTIAEAFAVKDGKFVAIGTTEEIQENYSAKEVIDAEGRAVYPGFYDSHAHFLGLAEYFGEADLFGAQSYEEVIERLKAYEAQFPDQEWIFGARWDQNLWPDKQFPTKDLLDEAFPDKPVLLSRVDYHASVVNTKAMELSGLTEIVEVPGGLVSGKNGVPDGLLIDKARSLITVPDRSEAEWLELVKIAQDSLFAVGLTSIVDAGVSPASIEMLKRFYNDKHLKFRNYAMIRGTSPQMVEENIKKGFYESDRFEVKSFKLSADGALGSRGAVMIEPYSDDPGNHGLLLFSPEELDEMVAKIAASPFQLNTHSIGDSANRIMLDLYGKHLTNNQDRRWRIEHAQIIAPNDFEKYKNYSILPSIQPTHATSDMYWAGDRIGKERLKGAYAFKDLLNLYGKVAIGTDFPVEHYNPMYSFHAAIARQDADNYPDGGFQMENALTREETLRGMTIWSAYGTFQEDKRGSIEKGKDADFFIMEEDLMTAPHEKIRNIRPIRTVVAGETVFVK